MQMTSDSDKITRDYFDSLLLETRYVDSAVPSTGFTLFGETFDTPIMTVPSPTSATLLLTGW